MGKSPINKHNSLLNKKKIMSQSKRGGGSDPRNPLPLDPPMHRMENQHFLTTLKL